MSEKLNIEQLFSSKLKEAEITPSTSTWKGVQRKLRWKQFMRFHPGQFNIYYLAGLILASLTLTLLLISRSANPLPVEPDKVPESIMEEGPDHAGNLAPQITESFESGKVEDPPNVNKEKTGVKIKDEPDQTSLSEQLSEPETQAEALPEEILPEASGDRVSANTLIKPQAVSPVIADRPQEPAQHVTSFTSSSQSGCVPLEVQFFNQTPDAVVSAWSFGGAGQSTERNPIFVFENAGKYTVTLTTENGNGSSSIHSQHIVVYDLPAADFSVDKGFMGLDGHVSLNLLNYSSGANAYAWCLLTEDLVSCGHWVSEEFQPLLHLTDLKNGADQMRLVVSNEYGCVDTVTKPLPIRMEANDVKIKFATAFSPNPTGPGDGMFSPGERRIELFHPIFLEVPAAYHLRVYTKRGEIAFETRDPYQGWDGYFHEERSAGGVYVWMLEGTWVNGETFKMQGDVTLIWQDIW